MSGRSFNQRLAVLGFLALTLSFPSSSPGTTGLDLTDRISVDGFSDEYEPDELIFQETPEGAPEESSIDSQWGRFNDLNNISITWDASFFYVAVEGFIFDNNTMVFFDTVPSPDGENPGLESLSEVNSWRRALNFDNGIFPDVFLATWDGNTTPQVWQYSGTNSVTQVGVSAFQTVASFSRDLEGRSMEAAIPWDVMFLGQGESAFSSDYGDTVYTLPEGLTEIRLVAWVTTGADGLGGPDSAPDNLSGHQVDAAVTVTLDNYVILKVDQVNAAGDSVPDGVPDFDAPVRVPTTPDLTREAYDEIIGEFFFVAPPVRGQALEIAGLEITPKVVAPDLAGERLSFNFSVTPRIEDPRLREARQLNFTAEIFDLQGNRVRTLFRERPFTVDQLDPENPTDVDCGVAGEIRCFDGKDAQGRPLEAGIYVLNLVLEPGQDQSKRALVVVR